jgi:hypothetical protein
VRKFHLSELNAMATFNSDMNSEFKRYATFSGVNIPAGVWPSQLAQGGFYRSGTSGNRVVCFSCGVEIDVKQFRGETVSNLHRRLSPACSFVSGSSNNEPVPAVDTHGFPGMDWLAQNFNLGSSPMDREFFSLPSGFLDCDVAEDGCTEEMGASQSLPPLNLSQADLLPVFPILSDLNTLEQSQTTNLDSLPSDLVYGLANTNLQSIALPAMFVPDSQDPASRSFGSIFGMSDDNLAVDSESVGTEGPELPPLMEQSEMHNYTSLDMLPSSNLLHNDEIQAPAQKQKLTFDDLGIIVQRPKRSDMVMLSRRLETFNQWKGANISQSKENIAEAGFYYAGMFTFFVQSEVCVCLCGVGKGEGMVG